MDLITFENLLISIRDFTNRLMLTFYHAIFRHSTFIRNVLRGGEEYTRPLSFMFICFMLCPLLGYFYALMKNEGVGRFIANYAAVNFWEVIQLTFIPFILTNIALYAFPRFFRINHDNNQLLPRFCQYITGYYIFTIQLGLSIGLVAGIHHTVPWYPFLLAILMLTPPFISSIKLNKIIRTHYNRVLLSNLYSKTILLTFLAFFFCVAAFFVFVIIHDTRIPIKISAKNYDDTSPYYTRYITLSCHPQQDSTLLEMDLMILNASDRKYYLKSCDTICLQKSDSCIIPFRIKKSTDLSYMEIPGKEFIRLTLTHTVDNRLFQRFRSQAQVPELKYPFYTVDGPDLAQTWSQEKIDSLLMVLR
ncbi:hypothetical protein ECE50_009130 [Chitinophaga sp. Mgbs1]|uniref:Uncharacterized protein n=1 Tax=Chitinophaga solisilvae TaxID=1233460 RepID=A0A3S1D4M0_9BACT|nr:hypothetical protein [Chitinophaga solisilvae]